MLEHRLKESRDLLLQSLHGLTSSQWNFKANPEGWCIFEILEHVTLAEDNMVRVLSDPGRAAHLSDAQRAEIVGKGEKLVAVLLDRSRRRQAPDMALPRGHWNTPNDTIEAFEQARKGAIHLAGRPEEDLRAVGAPHPILGLMDGMQWLMFFDAHARRHREQMEEVKLCGGYP